MPEQNCWGPASAGRWAGDASPFQREQAEGRGVQQLGIAFEQQATPHAPAHLSQMLLQVTNRHVRRVPDPVVGVVGDLSLAGGQVRAAQRGSAQAGVRNRVGRAGAGLVSGARDGNLPRRRYEWDRSGQQGGRLGQHQRREKQQETPHSRTLEGEAPSPHHWPQQSKGLVP
ncbi:hypothetical protein E0686_14900 [Deinococcus sp. S9]|nr:hypothetical protein E0686_14900 [Deinococcus sp. S9]